MNTLIKYWQRWCKCAIKTIKFCTAFGALVQNTILRLDQRFVLWRLNCTSIKKQDPFEHKQIKPPNSSTQAINLDFSFLNKTIQTILYNIDPGCSPTALCVLFIIFSLSNLHVQNVKVVCKFLRSLYKCYSRS